MEHPVFDIPDSWMEHPVGRSETIPNQALSIHNLFERSLSQQVSYNEDLYPEEDEDTPVLYVEDRLDAMDQLTYLQARNEAIRLAQERKKKAQEEQKSVELNSETPSPKN